MLDPVAAEMHPTVHPDVLRDVQLQRKQRKQICLAVMEALSIPNNLGRILSL